MEIDHAEDAFILMLHPDPIAHGPQIVTEMKIAAGLDAGENAIHEILVK
jgi:hypothetical protein